MAKHCVYCKSTLDESSVIDVCKSCGHKVWGEKMFNAIENKMKNAHEAGDLYQGSITEDSFPDKLRKVA